LSAISWYYQGLAAPSRPRDFAHTFSSSLSPAIAATHFAKDPGSAPLAASLAIVSRGIVDLSFLPLIVLNLDLDLDLTLGC